jgi:hypothetical protein
MSAERQAMASFREVRASQITDAIRGITARALREFEVFVEAER